jgi:hypothetical protein
MEDVGGQFGPKPEANPTTKATANDVIKVTKLLAHSKVTWRTLLRGTAHFGSKNILRLSN